MKIKLPIPLCSCMFATAFMTSQSQAAINITNFTISATSVSFDISGTFPALAPTYTKNAILITNPNISANPGFALGPSLYAISSSFSGAQTLQSFGPIYTDTPGLGDFFSVGFDRDFSPGESISGHLTAFWDTTAFDPMVVCDTYLQAFWGWNDLIANSGTQIDAEISVTCVPESSTSFLSASGIGLLMLRRRRA